MKYYVVRDYADGINLFGVSRKGKGNKEKKEVSYFEISSVVFHGYYVVPDALHILI